MGKNTASELNLALETRSREGLVLLKNFSPGSEQRSGWLISSSLAWVTGSGSSCVLSQREGWCRCSMNGQNNPGIPRRTAHQHDSP